MRAASTLALIGATWAATLGVMWLYVVGPSLKGVPL